MTTVAVNHEDGPPFEHHVTLNSTNDFRKLYDDQLSDQTVRADP
jgi:hypothetical protein